MGFLDDLGLDDVEVSDWSIPNGVYPAVITDSKIIPNNRNGNSWQITYRVLNDVESVGGKTVSEFFDLDPRLPDERKQFLKRRLQSLAISDEDARSIEPGDILGIEVTITVKNKPSADGSRTFTNVTKLVMGHSGDSNVQANASLF